MAKNINLNTAKNEKNDEFYTLLSTIERECVHYREQFKGKVILCNCDDPYESNFFKYFAMNFNFLGLKKLIATCYDGSPVAGTQLSFFDDSDDAEKKAYMVEIDSIDDLNGDGIINLDDVELLLRKPGIVKKLLGNGDYSSKECLALLEEADIVVTNPPFSKWRKFVLDLVKYNKKFLIIGNINAVKYKEIFPLIKENKVWIGYEFNKTMEFIMPDDYELKGKAYIDDNNKKHGFVPACAWFTNLDVKKHHEEMILFKSYNPIEYPMFDNYRAINVNSTSDIPFDYFGVMGVPITVLDKYNPNQFEIIGRTGELEWAETECDFFNPPSEEIQSKYKKIDKTWRVQNGYFVVNGIPKTTYDRIFIRRKK